jgi:hypothetical protein
MSDFLSPCARDGDCFFCEAVVEMVEGRYILDPFPCEPGPLFQVAKEDLIRFRETGEEVHYPDGKVRRLCLVALRRDSAAIRLEYVRLEEALASVPEFVADPDVVVPAAPGAGDSDVILVHP